MTQDGEETIFEAGGIKIRRKAKSLLPLLAALGIGGTTSGTFLHQYDVFGSRTKDETIARLRSELTESRELYAGAIDACVTDCRLHLDRLERACELRLR